MSDPYTSSLPGAITRTVDEKLDDFVSVLDFGADPTGATDSTDAFNLATGLADLATGNEDLPRREIMVPPGKYRINGTVFVRKGQHLRGHGPGAYIDCSHRGTDDPVFKLSSIDTGRDEGGLGAAISNFWLHGLMTNAPAIQATDAGYWIDHCFFTGCAIGIQSGGGDGIITNCQFDINLTDIVLRNAGNVIIASCNFYNSNYGVRILEDNRDIEINGCHFEYQKYASVLLGNGSGDSLHSRGITVRGNSFLMNEQFASFMGFICFGCSDAEVEVLGGNTFRNGYGAAIREIIGTGNKLLIQDALFDGKRTWIDRDGVSDDTSYAQSTTMIGVDASNMDVTINGALFRDLPGQPVVLGGTVATRLSMSDCAFSGNTGGTTEIGITNAALGCRVDLSNIRGDDTRPLFNAQSAVPVTAQGLKRWLGPIQASGSRKYVLVPVGRSQILEIAFKANAAPGGDLNYRKASRFLSVYGQDYNGSAQVEQVYTVEQIAFPSISGNPAFLAKLDLQVEIGAVGGGTSVAAPFPNSGQLAVSWPDSYASETLDIQLIV